MTLANKLTLARIFLAVPFTVLLASEKPGYRIAALAVFTVAAVTDYFDGKLARSLGQVSDLGKIMDPLADKIFISAALIIFMGIEQLGIPAWPVVLIITREFVVSGLRSIAASQGRVMAASAAGKIKTAIQMAAVFISLILIILEIYTPVYYLILITAAVTVYSGYVYIKVNLDLFGTR